MRHLLLALLVGCAVTPVSALPEVADPFEGDWMERVPYRASARLQWPTHVCSGVVVAQNLLLTARHCVTNGEPVIEVVVFPGRTVRVTRVVTNPLKDVAEVYIEGEIEYVAPSSYEMPAPMDVVFGVGFGCADHLEIHLGQYVAPLGEHEHLVLMGVCPGDSGGGVFDRKGRLIGIMSARDPNAPRAKIVTP